MDKILSIKEKYVNKYLGGLKIQLKALINLKIGIKQHLWGKEIWEGVDKAIKVSRWDPPPNWFIDYQQIDRGDNFNRNQTPTFKAKRLIMRYNCKLETIVITK